MFFFNRQLDELGRTRNMDQFVAVNILGFDAEQYVAIGLVDKQHDRRRLTAAKSIFVDDDFHAVPAIAQIR